MKHEFSKDEHHFLCSAAVDYVALAEIVYAIIDDGQRSRPTEEEFIRALDFIVYLFEKYGEHLKCLEGPDMHQRIEPLEELIDWLKEQFDAGKYTEIHYGIWFALDTEVIPPAYIPDEGTH